MNTEALITLILSHEPATQAVVRFGTSGTAFERPDSDLDVAILLPWERRESLLGSDLHRSLEEHSAKDCDLVNLRIVDTVFQKEIIATGQCVYEADRTALQEFEMLVLSFYQKLNEERREIIEDALASGRIVA